MPISWKKGRGKLGALNPLLGTWNAQADSPAGPAQCHRTFQSVLNGAYIQLTARWTFGDSARTYDEIDFYGARLDETLGFWSFTSDGKQSMGAFADISDIHPEAIGFEAQMPAGLARMAYWPDEIVGFRFVVESRTKRGWNRFLEHHYVPGENLSTDQ
jgi:hypothetical protein